MLKILILATLPQEYGFLKKLIPSRLRLLYRKPFKQFTCHLADKEIRLVETGMGAEWLSAGLNLALAQFMPDLLLFGGFCGGLDAEMHTGDVFIVEEAVAGRGDADGIEGIIRFRFPDELKVFLAKWGIRPMRSVTARGPEDKTTLVKSIAAHGAAGLPGHGERRPSRPAGENENESRGLRAGIDMETHPLAAVACREKLPLLCYRCVSDQADQELGFDLEAITGPGGKVRLGGVLRTIIMHPRTLKSFFLAWRRSVRAGRNLCRVLAAFLDMPGDSLRRIAPGIGIECD